MFSRGLAATAVSVFILGFCFDVVCSKEVPKYGALEPQLSDTTCNQLAASVCSLLHSSDPASCLD
jgi:hypothetical protein